MPQIRAARTPQRRAVPPRANDAFNRRRVRMRARAARLFCHIPRRPRVSRIQPDLMRILFAKAAKLISPADARARTLPARV